MISKDQQKQKQQNYESEQVQQKVEQMMQDREPKLEEQQIHAQNLKQNDGPIIDQPHKGTQQQQIAGDCLQTDQNSSSQSSQSSASVQNFQIVGSSNNSNNQALLVKLEVDSVLWHKGSVLFSSTPLKQRGDMINDAFWGILETTNLRNEPPQLLTNTSNNTAYFMLSKQSPYDGKILVLSQTVYKQDFYININHLLTINYDSSQYTLKPHSKLKQLKIVQTGSPTLLPVFITLQSTRNKSILQKYLAQDEHIYLPNANILAMSQTISYKWQSKNRLLRFTGPGFVFFQPCSKIGDLLPLQRRQFILANIGIFLTIVLLYAIQYVFLK